MKLNFRSPNDGPSASSAAMPVTRPTPEGEMRSVVSAGMLGTRGTVAGVGTGLGTGSGGSIAGRAPQETAIIGGRTPLAPGPGPGSIPSVPSMPFMPCGPALGRSGQEGSNTSANGTLTPRACRGPPRRRYDASARTALLCVMAALLLLTAPLAVPAVAHRAGRVARAAFPLEVRLKNGTRDAFTQLWSSTVATLRLPGHVDRPWGPTIIWDGPSTHDAAPSHPPSSPPPPRHPPPPPTGLQRRAVDNTTKDENENISNNNFGTSPHPAVADTNLAITVAATLGSHNHAPTDADSKSASPMMRRNAVTGVDVGTDTAMLMSSGDINAADSARSQFDTPLHEDTAGGPTRAIANRNQRVAQGQAASPVAVGVDGNEDVAGRVGVHEGTMTAGVRHREKREALQRAPTREEARNIDKSTERTVAKPRGKAGRWEKERSTLSRRRDMLQGDTMGWAPYAVVRGGRLWLGATIQARLNGDVAPLLVGQHAAVTGLCPGAHDIRFDFSRSPRVRGAVEVTAICGSGTSCMSHAPLRDLRLVAIDPAPPYHHHHRYRQGHDNDDDDDDDLDTRGRYYLIPNAVYSSYFTSPSPLSSSATTGAAAAARDVTTRERQRTWGPLRGLLRITMAEDSTLYVTAMCPPAAPGHDVPAARVISVAQLRAGLRRLEAIDGDPSRSAVRWRNAFRYDAYPRRHMSARAQSEHA